MDGKTEHTLQVALSKDQQQALNNLKAASSYEIIVPQALIWLWLFNWSEEMHKANFFKSIDSSKITDKNGLKSLVNTRFKTEIKEKISEEIARDNNIKWQNDEDGVEHIIDNSFDRIGGLETDKRKALFNDPINYIKKVIYTNQQIKFILTKEGEEIKVQKVTGIIPLIDQYSQRLQEVYGSGINSEGSGKPSFSWCR